MIIQKGGRGERRFKDVSERGGASEAVGWDRENQRGGDADADNANVDADNGDADNGDAYNADAYNADA